VVVWCREGRCNNFCIWYLKLWCCFPCESQGTAAITKRNFRIGPKRNPKQWSIQVFLWKSAATPALSISCKKELRFSNIRMHKRCIIWKI
jgi:hypothetical protein